MESRAFDGGVVRRISRRGGLVGLEPTRGRVSEGPLVGEAWAGGVIGVLDRPGMEGFLHDPQCRAAVASTARLLESLGHHVDQSPRREDLLIRVASQLEEAAPWSGRHPPVHA